MSMLRRPTKEQPVLSLMIILIFVSVLAVRARGGDELVISDFENGYGGWRTEGGAFERDPAGGLYGPVTLPAGFADARFAHSGLQGEKMLGVLTSPAVSIQREVIHFLVGIGAEPGEAQKNMKDTLRVELLVGGRVVRSIMAGEIENARPNFLNWESWNVSEYQGREGVIRVVDESTTRGGHILVDHFVQSDQRQLKQPVIATDGEIRHLENATDLKLTGRYILIPVSFQKYEKNKAIRALGLKNRRRMLVTVDGKLIYNVVVDFARSAEQVDWWASLDVSEYVGRTAKISVRTVPEVARMIHSSDQLKHIQPLYDEVLRPQFHFSQMQGWNGDPNGLCYYDGEYHFSWQSSPLSVSGTNKFWGHAVSRDLIHWTELQPRLRPDGFGAKNKHQAMAIGSCFSGSGNVDDHNSGGWQTGNEKTMIAVFSDTGGSESLAYSNDRGRTWQLYDGNPVKELESLRRPDPVRVSNRRLTAQEPTASVPVTGQLFDLLLTLQKGTASRVSIQFGETRVLYDFIKESLNGMPVAPHDGRVKIRMLVDRPMYEVIGGDGARYQTDLRRRDGGKPLGAISVTAEQGEATIESLEIYQMQSIWKQ